MTQTVYATAWMIAESGIGSALERGMYQTRQERCALGVEFLYVSGIRTQDGCWYSGAFSYGVAT